MIKKVILHAGRHKTGTSSLQKVLVNNRAKLFNEGILYPETGVRGYGHHEIAERLSRQNELSYKKNKELSKLKDILIAEISNSGRDSILLSSEAFQNCRPNKVKEFFSAFTRDITIIFYVRNKVDYLISAYSQKVHATNYVGTISNFAKKFYKLDYSKYFDEWGHAFSENLNVRLYDKKYLADSDIVADFFINFLPDGLAWDNLQIDANPSIRTETVAYKLALNELYPELGHNKHLYNFFSSIAGVVKGAKVPIPMEVFQRLIKNSHNENTTISDFTQIAHPFEYAYTLPEPFNYKLLNNIDEAISECELQELQIELDRKKLLEYSRHWLNKISEESGIDSKSTK